MTKSEYAILRDKAQEVIAKTIEIRARSQVARAKSEQLHADLNILLLKIKMGEVLK